MYYYFRDNKVSNRRAAIMLYGVLIFATTAFIALTVVIIQSSRPAPSYEASESEVVPAPSYANNVDTIIRRTASDFGVPPVFAIRLAAYIAENRKDFSGIGLYAVNPQHLEWLLSDTLVSATGDLSDPQQNAIVAMSLISGYYRHGLDWVGAFIAYTFGAGMVPGSNRSEEVKRFVILIFGLEE